MMTADSNAQVGKLDASEARLVGRYALPVQRTDNFSSSMQTIVTTIYHDAVRVAQPHGALTRQAVSAKSTISQ